MKAVLLIRKIFFICDNNKKINKFAKKENVSINYLRKLIYKLKKLDIIQKTTSNNILFTTSRGEKLKKEFKDSKEILNIIKKKSNITYSKLNLIFEIINHADTGKPILEISYKKNKSQQWIRQLIKELKDLNYIKNTPREIHLTKKGKNLKQEISTLTEIIRLIKLMSKSTSEKQKQQPK